MPCSAQTLPQEPHPALSQLVQFFLKCPLPRAAFLGLLANS